MNPAYKVRDHMFAKPAAAACVCTNLFDEAAKNYRLWDDLWIAMLERDQQLYFGIGSWQVDSIVQEQLG